MVAFFTVVNHHSGNLRKENNSNNNRTKAFRSVVARGHVCQLLWISIHYVFLGLFVVIGIVIKDSNNQYLKKIGALILFECVQDD